MMRPREAPTGPSEQERALQAQVAALQAQLGQTNAQSAALQAQLAAAARAPACAQYGGASQPAPSPPPGGMMRASPATVPDSEGAVNPREQALAQSKLEGNLLLSEIKLKQLKATSGWKSALFIEKRVFSGFCIPEVAQKKKSS